MVFIILEIPKLTYMHVSWRLSMLVCNLCLLIVGYQLLVLDDTWVEKFGDLFEACSTLHDHAYHNEISYLHGHCFVCLTMQIPISNNGSYQDIKVSIAYKLWTPKKYENNVYRAKYQIAADMLENAYKVIGTQVKICGLCDAWDPKKEVIEFINKYDNVEAVVNVRIDTSLCALPPEKNR